MISLYDTNGLVHWSERQIKARERFTQFFADEVAQFLLSENKAWIIERTEGPIMLPARLVNSNYSDDDLWKFTKHKDSEIAVVARPETTHATYAWMVNRLDHNAKGKATLPYCCWQIGKSFRNEVTDAFRLSHVRLKEFYQMEFQCAFGAGTMNDYQEKCLIPIRQMISRTIGLPSRIVDSDRLPSYSSRTVDIEIDTGHRWMEVCSISLRNDFPIRYAYTDNRGIVKATDIKVLEIAIGMDRVVALWSGVIEGQNLPHITRDY